MGEFLAALDGGGDEGGPERFGGFALGLELGVVEGVDDDEVELAGAVVGAGGGVLGVEGGGAGGRAAAGAPDGTRVGVVLGAGVEGLVVAAGAGVPDDVAAEVGEAAGVVDFTDEAFVPSEMFGADDGVAPEGNAEVHAEHEGDFLGLADDADGVGGVEVVLPGESGGEEGANGGVVEVGGENLAGDEDKMLRGGEGGEFAGGGVEGVFAVDELDEFVARGGAVIGGGDGDGGEALEVGGGLGAGGREGERQQGGEGDGGFHGGGTWRGKARPARGGPANTRRRRRAASETVCAGRGRCVDSRG